MSSTLHSELLSQLNSLVASSSTSKSDQGSAKDLSSKIESIWQSCNPLQPNGASSSATTATSANGQGESSKAASANEKRLEMIRAVLELVGREVVVSPLIDGTLLEPEGDDVSEREAFLAAFSLRLDVILTLYEVVYASAPEAVTLEPGALFIPLLEELVELLSVEIWRDLWGYIETRSKRFTKDMPASRGKALPLLRILNSFLRFLPRTPEDLVFRGRIHQFAGSVISVADKSAVNMRGDYSDIRTTWEEDEVEVEAKAETETGDVEMGDGKEGDKQDKKGEVKKEAEPDFYSTLWSLQHYFSNPPSLDGPPTGTPPITPFEQFKAKTDFVLPKLFEETQKEKATAGVESSSTSGSAPISQSPTSRKRKRDLPETTGPAKETPFFHPRYLTGRRLLSHELADPSFRRQMLVQYFILFQFLLNLTPGSAAKQAFTGGVPKTFVVGTEDQEWVRKKIGIIQDELRKMGRDGRTFQNTVMSVIKKETHYAQWKNDGCPESVFDVLPLDDDSATQAAEGWKRHCRPPARFPHKLGSRPLTALWRNGFENIDQLKGWKRSTTVEGLDEELKSMEEGMEDDKAMGREPSAEDQAAFDELRIKNTWRGLRLASHTNLRHFISVNEKRDLHRLVASLKNGLDTTVRSTARATTETEDDGVVTKEMVEDSGPKENGTGAKENGEANGGMEVDTEAKEEDPDAPKTPELEKDIVMAS